jgi:DNA-binding CsgD family transcriptional regulator
LEEGDIMPQENRFGYYVAFRVDVDGGQMRLAEASASLQAWLPEGPLPLPPLFVALEAHYRQCCQCTPPCRLVVDVQFGTDRLLQFMVHRTENFRSVVEVSREQLRDLLRRDLSPRETEAAILLFEGSTIRYTAAQMQIAEGTVKRMIYNIYKKMRLASQVELIREIYARLAQRASLREGYREQDTGG